MALATDRINFRCSPRLREKLQEAAHRSGVSLSRQARLSLERLYGVEEEERLWLPAAIREEKPSSKRPHFKKVG